MATSPISTQSAFDQQSEILQSCLADLEGKQTTVADCIQKFPEFPELNELLYATNYLAQLPPVSLSPNSRSQVQARIMECYRQRPIIRDARPAVLPRARWSMFLRPLVALVIIALLLYSGGSSFMYAASQSIPGEGLYSVKRTAEDVQLSFTAGEARVSLLDSLANIRLDEVAILVKRGITLTEPILTDVTAFVQRAISVQTDLARRAALAQRTTDTFDAAQRAGLLSAELEDKMLAQLDPTSTQDEPIQAVDKPTVTPTATPNGKPTRKPRPTKVKGKGNGDSNLPKGRGGK
jgi:hypothetical protein